MIQAINRREQALNTSTSPWVKKSKNDKIWLCGSVGKLKGIGKQGEVKMNEINVHSIANIQRYAFCQRPQEIKKSIFLKIWRDMG